MYKLCLIKYTNLWTELPSFIISDKKYYCLVNTVVVIPDFANQSVYIVVFFLPFPLLMVLVYCASVHFYNNKVTNMKETFAAKFTSLA